MQGALTELSGKVHLMPLLDPAAPVVIISLAAPHLHFTPFFEELLRKNRRKSILRKLNFLLKQVDVLEQGRGAGSGAARLVGVSRAGVRARGCVCGRRPQGGRPRSAHVSLVPQLQMAKS